MKTFCFVQHSIRQGYCASVTCRWCCHITSSVQEDVAVSLN